MIALFKRSFSCLLICLIFNHCSAHKEYIMPFYNYQYSGDRLFPIAANDDDFTFRVWINNGTSIERIISVFKSKYRSEGAYLNEIGLASGSDKSRQFYSKRQISPTSGIEKFIERIDSLNLYNYQSQLEEIPLELHQPISMYVVEIKNKGRYHCFRFNTNYPGKQIKASVYETIQRVIFEEFKYKFYFDKR